MKVYEQNREEIDSYLFESQAMRRQRRRDLALLSTRGQYVDVEESGHFIHSDQPDRVLEAIREVVEAARQINEDLRERHISNAQ